MSSVVIPLETPKELDDGWGQYVKIDIKEEPVSNLAYVTTSLVDLEEGTINESNDEYIDYYCTIC
tara:strand:+ start:2509 stop:2703 length:195 start_codon:yes stop_codon:yes gene_type:complete